VTQVQFRPDVILAVLHQHHVRYVVIGGFAATLNGSASPTYDIDIVPDPAPDNLGALSSALRDLDARIRVDGIPGGVPFAHDAAVLAQITVLNLVTRAGELDVALHPAGIADFGTWDAGAVSIVVLGTPTRIAGIGDVIASKEAADRDKDRAVLPMLRELARRLERGAYG